jgi:hypothetical protein
MGIQKLEDLEESKCYIVSFDVNEPPYSQKFTLTEIRVLIKLKNTIKLFINNEIRWYLISKSVIICDEIPIKYYRKEKLQKLDSLDDDLFKIE